MNIFIKVLGSDVIITISVDNKDTILDIINKIKENGLIVYDFGLLLKNKLLLENVLVASTDIKDQSCSCNE